MFKAKRRLVQPKVRSLAHRSLRLRRRSLHSAHAIAVALAITATALILIATRRTVTVDDSLVTPADLARGATVSTCFTLAQACRDEIVTRINKATSEIRVQAYGFTSAPILLALVSAKERGVDVAAILDKSNERLRKKSRYSGATFVSHGGIPVFIDYQPAIAHNKIIIIDRHIVITGSYNFTRRAERNAENVTFIDSIEVVSRFLSNWNARRAVSSAYVDYAE